MDRTRRDNRTVQLPAPIEPGLRYAATAMTSPGTVRPVVVGGSENRAPYLQLPPDLDPRIAALARDATAAAGDAFARAQALESHLRSQYAYSFDTVFTSQGDTPLAGFCSTRAAGTANSSPPAWR